MDKQVASDIAHIAGFFKFFKNMLLLTGIIIMLLVAGLAYLTWDNRTHKKTPLPEPAVYDYLHEPSNYDIILKGPVIQHSPDRYECWVKYNSSNTGIQIRVFTYERDGTVISSKPYDGSRDGDPPTPTKK